MARRFEIDDTIRRQSRRYNAVGTQLTVRLLPPSDNGDTVGHFLASVNDFSEYALQNVSDSDMVGITIQNQVNHNKPIGISCRRKDPETCFGAYLRKRLSLILDLTPWTLLS